MKRSHDARAKSKPNAYDKALSLLARREYSRKELQQKPSRGGYSTEKASAALERLGQMRYQDDARALPKPCFGLASCRAMALYEGGRS